MLPISFLGRVTVNAGRTQSRGDRLEVLSGSFYVSNIWPLAVAKSRGDVVEVGLRRPITRVNVVLKLVLLQLMRKVRAYVTDVWLGIIEMRVPLECLLVSVAV